MRLASAMVALALAGACSRPAPPPQGRTVRDGMGRAVVVPERVARVVSLAPSSTEILFALGAAQLVVGVDRYSNFPAAAAALPQLGADVDPNLERLLALRPDLVFLSKTANARSTDETLQRLHVPVFVSRDDGLDDIYRDVTGIADAIGRHGDGVRLAGEVRGRVDAVRARVRGMKPVPTLVVVWSSPLIVAGKGSHVSDLLAAAGGVNIVDDSDLPYPTYSLERLLARAPEVMIVGTHSTGSSPPIEPLLRLAAVPAVRDHRIYTVDGDLVFRPGPRVADAVEQLGRLLHP